MWGYLTEFWDAIESVGDTTIAWFQQVGNAVAGAIGGLFEDLIHHIYDVFYIGEWFLDNLASMLLIAFRPLIWVFNFVKGFFVSATLTIEEMGLATSSVPELVIFTEDITNIFESFPYFDLLITGVGGALGLLMVAFIIKKLIHI